MSQSKDGRSKASRFLEVFQNNLGQWVCSLCNTGSNQPAAIFREVKKLGYAFEEVAPNRWALSKHCTTCNQNTTHYKLLHLTPYFTSKPRLSVRPEDRKRILALLGHVDAITGASITSTPEIDHKIPFRRLIRDIDVRAISSVDIPKHFQVLTREHNLLKDRMCSMCSTTDLRPPFLKIPFWYEGDGTYRGSCEGCGWYDPKAWKNAIITKL